MKPSEKDMIVCYNGRAVLRGVFGPDHPFTTSRATEEAARQHLSEGRDVVWIQTPNTPRQGWLSEFAQDGSFTVLEAVRDLAQFLEPVSA